MKNLKTIFNFEFMEMVKKRSILLSTAIIALLIFGATFIPRFIPTDDIDTPSTPIELMENTLFVSDNPELLDKLKSVFGESESITFLNDTTSVEEQLKSETVDRVYVVTSETSYQVFTEGQMSNTYQDIYEAVLGSVIANERLEALGVNVEDVLAAQEVQFDSEVNFLGKDGFQGYFFALAMLFSLYILILIYGQSVATSVAREKDNRTMELLITSTKPKALIIGKVLAVGLVGLLQLFTIIFGLVLGYLINKSTYPDVIHYFLKTSVQLDVILVYLVFSILGYLLYLFIFAALGSLVSKVEDVASSVTPITFLFVAAYMIATFGMNAPDSTLLKISSYVPFVSLFTTPIRYMMTNVSIFELLGSLLTMVVTTLIVMQLSIIIYRQGSLNYGNKMSLVKVIKSLIKKESII